MQKKSFTLPGINHHQTPVHAWLPDAEPNCILHIAHGMAEHALRYEPIATYFVNHNVAVYAHDQRGHGNAVAGIDQQGIVEHDWFNKQVAEIDIIITHLKNVHPGKKIFLLGHSMGSFIAQRYFQLQGSHINGLVLSASNGKRDPLLGAGIAIAWIQMKLMGAAHQSHLIDRLSFGRFNASFKPNRTSHDWLSRNTEVVDKYIADPRCGFISSAGYFYYFFKGIATLLKKENIRLIPSSVPVYAFAGDKDPVGLSGKGFMALINNWKKARVKDMTYDLYPGGRHEMMNEINSTEVLENLLKWIKEKT